MKGVLSSWTVLSLGILLAVPAGAATEEPTSSAWQWLGMLDNGQYAQSWADGSIIFRTRITERSWESKIQIFRDAVGTIVWRDVLGVSTVADPPDLPRGVYAVVHYRSRFTGDPDRRETVILTLEKGFWRVATYDIK